MKEIVEKEDCERGRGEEKIASSFCNWFGKSVGTGEKH